MAETATLATPTSSVVTSSEAKPVYQEVPIEKIKPSRHQARKDFDDVQGLADCMREEGLIEPVVLRQVDDGYELISGERRLRAAKLLNWSAIEAKVIRTVSEAEAAAKGLVENLQRQDLNPIEEAEGFQTLNQLDPKFWDQPQIAKVSGRSQEYISLSLKLLGLDPQVQESIRRRILSRSHGLEIMRLPHEKQVESAEKAKDMSQKDTRKLVDGMLGKKASPSAPLPKGGGGPLKEVGEAFSFKSKGNLVSFTGSYDPSQDLDAFFAQFKAALASWLVKNPTKSSSRGASPASDVAIPTATSSSPMAIPPMSEEDVQKLWEEDNQVRLPKTEQEQAELEKLAAGGPGSVYAWLYGSESLHAQKAAATTWQDMDMADPIAGCRQVIQGIKALQEFDPEKFTQDEGSHPLEQSSASVGTHHGDLSQLTS
jgi:ParB family chromosome partitioning protein